jgi:predicted RecA/RadA family phage recombinase
MKKMFIMLAIALCMVVPAFCAQNHVSDAGSVAYLNPGAKILSGQIVDLTYRYGIAASDISSNETETVFTDGIWRLARADTNAIVLGANVYQSSATNVTGTSTGNRYIGVCVQAVAVCTSVYDSSGNPSKWVNVDIGAPQRQIVIGVDTQPHSAYLDTLALGLASNKYWVGSVLGAPAAFPFSGLFTTTVGGVASATTTGLAWTNIAGGVVATNIGLTMTNMTAVVPVTVTNMTAVVPVTTTNMLASLTKTTTNMTAVVPVTVTNMLASVGVSTMSLVYLDASSNVVTQTVVTAVSENVSAIGSAGTPTLSAVLGDVTENVSAIGSAGTPVLSAIGSAGTPTLSSIVGNASIQTATPQTDTFVKP